MTAPNSGRIATFGLAAALACAGICAPAQALDTFASVRERTLSSESVLTDRNGVVVQTVRSDGSVRRLPWVALESISPALRTAMLLSEDRNFYQHAGVDWAAVSAAAWSNLWNTRTRGASTITMQLAGLIDSQDVGKAGRSVRQKVGQTVLALRLERTWKKSEILEAYLNLVSFRGEVVGVPAISAQLFEKEPSGLDTREGAIIAALVRSPNARTSLVATRACAILREEALGEACNGLSDYIEFVLARRAPPRLDSQPSAALHLAHALLRPGTSTTVRSTLDASLQYFARTALHQQLMELSGRNVNDGAVLVLDNATGDVLAWVGSSGQLSSSAWVDNITAPRQAGSTLKPFLYELALERRWITAGSILDDAPVDLATGSGLYIPENYDHDFKGLVSVRTALGSSLNIPAVRTLVLVTPTAFHQRLVALGFKLKETGDYYGYSLALGSAEVSLAQLTNAYRTLANGGKSSPLRTRMDEAPTVPKRIMGEDPSFIVSDVLGDRNARGVTFGLENVLSTRFWSAAKTGTSKDMRDNWCVGYSARYTVGVWVGNDSGAPMWDVSGVSGAAPLWRSVMDYLHGRDPDLHAWADPKSSPPAGVTMRRVTFDPAIEPTRDEWFVNGTEESNIRLAMRAQTSANPLSSPVEGTIIGLDPDIPAGVQKLRFKAVPGSATDPRWRVDGRLVGRGLQMDWPVWPGQHTVELLDGRGAVLGVAHFEVRGARVRARQPAISATSFSSR